jgi:hypothetical protein
MPTPRTSRYIFGESVKIPVNVMNLEVFEADLQAVQYIRLAHGSARVHSLSMAQLQSHRCID